MVSSLCWRFVGAFSLVLLIQVAATGADPWNFVLDPGNPVLTAIPGTWEELLVEIDMVKVGGDYYLYYQGQEVSSRGRIGLATSADRTNFTRQPSWVLDHGLLGEFDDWIVGVPRALWFPGTGMRLWYNAWDGTVPWSERMGEADAPDGIAFTRHPSNPQWNTVALGCRFSRSSSVIYDVNDPDPNRLYKQYVGLLCSSVNRIGLITSSDGVSWSWYGYVIEPGPPGSWDDDVVRDPFVLEYSPGAYLMLYMSAADELGLAVSSDAMEWVKHPDSPVAGLPEPMNYPKGVLEGNVLHLWYNNTWKGDEIRHMWSEVPDGLFDILTPTPTVTPTGIPTPTPTHTPTPTPTLTPTITPTPLPVCGPEGYSLYFDGGDHVYLGTDVLLNPESQYTIELWVQPRVASNPMWAFTRWDEGVEASYKLGLLDGRFRYETWFPGCDLDSSKPYEERMWTHLAAVFDDGDVSLYRNGARQDSETGAGNDLTSVATLIGAIHVGGTPSNGWRGLIDEVRLWAAPRSEEQIFASMYEELTGAEPDLIGYWNFNEGWGQVAHDGGPNGLDGILGATTSAGDDDPEWFPCNMPDRPPWLTGVPERLWK